MWRALGKLQQPLLGLVGSAMGPFKPSPTPTVLPKGFDPHPETPENELGRIVQDLTARKEAWVQLSTQERAKLLQQCLDTTLEVFEEAAAAATAAKGSYGYGIGEEMTAWVPIICGMKEYIETLQAGGQPKPVRVWKREGGQTVVDVWPQGLEGLLWGGFSGEIWIEPGKEPTQGRLYREKAAGGGGEGGVGLVLGAGNQVAVVVLDILHKLVADDEVVVCKMNPVNEYLGPFLRRALQPLVDAGFLEFVYGGGKVGAFLCNHPDVTSVHLTGSAATYDAIVWQGKPKVGKPPFTKPVGAELGCVTPYIIVPGPWSDSDIDYHAENVATGLTQNAGHNCLKAELVLTDAEWPLRDKFLVALRTKLAAMPNRVAYYPGSHKKHAAFLQQFPDAEALGGGSTEADGATLSSPEGHADMKVTPWLLKTGLSPDQAATQDENWCGVLQEVTFTGCGGDAAAFLATVVPYCNDRCWGTLSCAMFIHPKSQSKYPGAYEDAVAALKYGTIAINCPGGVAFAATRLLWGGYPGVSTPQEIGSGNCFVHNTMLFDNVEKSVVRGPWRFFPSPPFWSPLNRNLEAICRQAARFCAKPSMGRMLLVAKEALRG